MINYFFFLTLFSLLLAYFTRSLTATEMRLLWAAFAIHAIFAVGQVFYTIYVFKGGDMLGYHRTGGMIAQMVQSDLRLLPDVFWLALGQYTGTFGWVRGVGTSTGAMPAFSALATMLVGHYLVAKCLLFAMASFLGKVLLYFSFKPHIPKAFHRRALIASVLVPSVIFWSSGIIKEAVTMCGLGLVMFFASSLVARKRIDWKLICMGALGVAAIAMSKSYVLVVLVISVAVWIIGERVKRKNGYFKLTFKNAIVLTTLMGALLAVIGIAFPQYSLNSVGSEASKLQHSYRRQESAGSSIEVVEVSRDEGMGGQITNFPTAVISSLFRPFIFEVRNAAMLINALETTFVLGLLLMILYRRGFLGTWKFFSQSPFLLFLFVYVAIFAVALGLTTPNLGTLSRYRIPMFPMYWLLLFCLLPVKGKKGGQARRSKIPRYRGNTASIENRSTALARPALP